MTAPVAAPYRPLWRRAGAALLIVLFAFAAAWFALTTLCAIVNFGFRQPMWDQWREYETLLGLPFPANVIQLANGHRPILPNLVRVAEIRWFGGDQLLQLSVGASCAFLSAAILAAAALGERSMGPAARAAGVLIAVLGVLWLGNARRLLHGSEALHGYLPTLAALCAVWLMYRARRAADVGALAGACIACVAATFSFGLGLAAFAGVLAVAIVCRQGRRNLLAPIVTMALCAILYVGVLPGSSGVRGELQFEPLATMAMLFEWIGAPFGAAWLELAKFPQASTPLTLAESMLVGSAIRIARSGNEFVNATCLLFGLSGVAAHAALFVGTMRRKDDVGRLEALAIGTGAYAICCALITVFARLQYLIDNPDQVYADRYLAWPCLFWCALGLQLLKRVASAQGLAIRVAATMVMLLAPLFLAVTQYRNSIWGAIVYRIGQQTSAQLRSGVYDAAHFPGELAANEEQLRRIDLLRAHRIAMFAEPAWQRLGTQWTGSLEPTAEILAEAHWLTDLSDPTARGPAGHIEGWVTRGIGKLRSAGQLVLLTTGGTIAGFADFSFISPKTEALRLRFPTKRGFDGYLRDYDPSAEYTLAVADFAANRAIALTTLAPAAGTDGPRPANESPE